MTPSISTTIFLTLKMLAIIGLAVYAVFAAIMVRQEYLMASVLEERYEPMLRLITLVHLGIAVFVLVMAIIIL